MIHALNQWMHDEWTFDYQHRIFATPVVNPACPSSVSPSSSGSSSAGRKVVLLRPAPVAGTRGTKSPFLPEFDPFWARVEESGVLVALHGSDSGYQRYANDWNGQTGEMQPFKPPPFSAASTEAGPSPTRSTRPSATACSAGSPGSSWPASRTGGAGRSRA